MPTAAAVAAAAATAKIQAMDAVATNAVIGKLWPCSNVAEGSRRSDSSSLSCHPPYDLSKLLVCTKNVKIKLQNVVHLLMLRKLILSPVGRPARLRCCCTLLKLSRLLALQSYLWTLRLFIADCE